MNQQECPKCEMIISSIGQPCMCGTPKTLDEAVEHAICIGPLREVRERSYHVFKDFLAQKFGVAYLNASPETLEVLQDLFDQLTQRPTK